MVARPYRLYVTTSQLAFGTNTGLSISTVYLYVVLEKTATRRYHQKPEESLCPPVFVFAGKGIFSLGILRGHAVEKREELRIEEIGIFEIAHMCSVWNNMNLGARDPLVHRVG